jgi:hypothetical protein
VSTLAESDLVGLQFERRGLLRVGEDIPVLPGAEELRRRAREALQAADDSDPEFGRLIPRIWARRTRPACRSAHGQPTASRTPSRAAGRRSSGSATRPLGRAGGPASCRSSRIGAGAPATRRSPRCWGRDVESPEAPRPWISAGCGDESYLGLGPQGVADLAGGEAGRVENCDHQGLSGKSFDG